MWITAIVLGFAGSLHCVGMCSPLALAVTSMNSRGFRNRLLYNGGRVFTYGLMGGTIAFFGAAIRFSNVQFVLTLSLAVTLIIVGLSGISGMRIPLITPLLIRFTTVVKGWFGKFLRQRTMTAMWITGMLNGLLPCGLTYLALTYCLTLAGPADGFQFMLLFGIGTLPAMIGLTSVAGIVMRKLKVNYATVSRVSFILIGLLVLARLYFAQEHALHPGGDPAGIIFCP